MASGWRMRKRPKSGATVNPKDTSEQFFALFWGDSLVARLLAIAGVPEPAEIDRGRAASRRRSPSGMPNRAEAHTVH